MLKLESLDSGPNRSYLGRVMLYLLQKPEIKSKISLILQKETLEKKDIESVLKIVYDTGGLSNSKNYKENSP